MSIVYLVGQAQIYEWYKDTNRIECSFMFLLFGLLHLVYCYTNCSYHSSTSFHKRKEVWWKNEQKNLFLKWVIESNNGAKWVIACAMSPQSSIIK